MKREATILEARRKQLGQFFSGLPLGKLLAHLATTESVKMVLDPMAGDGDLLEAAYLAIIEAGGNTLTLDGIEIDQPFASRCMERLERLTGAQSPPRIFSGDAFDEVIFSKLLREGYDLVIANPPYVRRESRAANELNGVEHTRAGLRRLVAQRSAGSERKVWAELIEGYSGLADLSLSSFLLASMLVRPGGKLALVLPATWRSRQYADVMRYVLLRFFDTQFIVEDTQPGWFPHAEVRTSLVVAERLDPTLTKIPLRERETWRAASRIEIAATAASKESLVGSAFEGENPECRFARWARGKMNEPVRGIAVSSFEQHQDWINLETQTSQRGWLQKVEGAARTSSVKTTGFSIPDALRDLMPPNAELGSLVKLNEVGIETGQGLRTGCNDFFYVTQVGHAKDGWVKARTAQVLGGQELDVPEEVLIPVLRKQAEIASFRGGKHPDGRILFLRDFVLPEDREAAEKFRQSYLESGITLPRTMPEQLSQFVRLAARTNLKGRDHSIPQLSAVRTNAYLPRAAKGTPRFWYMLPDLMKRHIPAAFVGRINHGLPWVERNALTPVAIDANFTTFWSLDTLWTGSAIKALLNSVWCRSFMEAHGTRFGGGALKLEAAHIREICVPRLSNDEISILDRLGLDLSQSATNAQASVDAIVVGAALRASTKSNTAALTSSLHARARALSTARQKAA